MSSFLKIPERIADWQGKDVAVELNRDKEVYNFISEVFAREYANKNGQGLLLLILDAGNFHLPNVCFTSAGFKVKELEKTEFYALGRTVKAHTIFTEKTRKNEQFLIIYWIVIDKKFIPNWVEQKLKQLYFSLFKKKRVGLMVRLDIPVNENKIEDAITLAKQFINDLGIAISVEEADYLFGKTNN